MKPLIPVAFALLFALGAAAQTVPPETPQGPPPLEVLDAANVTLDDFLWSARPLVIFADTSADPRFQRQMELLASRPNALAERDVVVITDTTPTPPGKVRERLHPRGFALVLIDKDGTVLLRKPAPWHVRELSRAIDKTPLRQQELKEQRDQDQLDVQP